MCAPLGQGSYGTIFTCRDLRKGLDLVVKFQEQYEILGTEIAALKSIRSKRVTKLLSQGVVVVANMHRDNKEKMIAGYYIMPKYT